eukprot:gnl/TRDRNA2_/TRDRNA2_35394_c0_seq1.p1 gnl/TRDRNA2_/TRDRNA2_35394_c0~~gnl/TRDRNA2_/TRDRNA2_35394_c0_seq1.p1  ORF type:complete len:121 (+),score=34.33 gnl/TRDRNA2_/TRDRNA2_35394_c0_seq1:81-443(+)
MEEAVAKFKEMREALLRSIAAEPAMQDALLLGVAATVVALLSTAMFAERLKRRKYEKRSNEEVAAGAKAGIKHIQSHLESCKANKGSGTPNGREAVPRSSPPPGQTREAGGSSSCGCLGR